MKYQTCGSKFKGKEKRFSVLQRVALMCVCGACVCARARARVCGACTRVGVDVAKKKLRVVADMLNMRLETADRR